jgi:hypothetical protein
MPAIDPKSKLGLFVSHVMPGVVRPMRVLWHEVFGFLFLSIALIMGVGTARTIGTPQASPGRLMIAGSLVLTFLYFGITSFLRARKINRS